MQSTRLDALEELHPDEAKQIVDDEISRYIDPTLTIRTREVKWQVDDSLREIEEEVLEVHDEEVEDLRADYDSIIADLAAWENRADEVWAKISDQMEPRAPEIGDYKVPKPRAAEEPDLPVLFDSKRDYLSQLDHYHAWQRRFDGSDT